MDQKSLNYILIIVIVILAFNLFYPIKNLYKAPAEKLNCEINGNAVSDINLCCYEMSRFTSCKNGLCKSSNYDIVTNKETLKYCESEGYDVRF